MGALESFEPAARHSVTDGEIDGGLYALRPIWSALLRPAEDGLVESGIPPNILTAATIPISFLAGVAIALGASDRVVWMVVPPLLVVLVAFAALDGGVARRTRRAGPRGVAFNELAARFTDIALLGAGFVVAPTLIAVAALALVMSAEFVSTIGWVATGRRDESGPLAMPGRLLLLGIGALVAIAWAGALGVVYALVALGSLVTLGRRIRKIMTIPGAAPGHGGPS